MGEFGSEFNLILLMCKSIKEKKTKTKNHHQQKKLIPEGC